MVAAPYTLKVWDGVGEVVLSDVMLGEVWLCSGSPTWSGRRPTDLPTASARWPPPTAPTCVYSISPSGRARSPQDDCYGRWDVCTPEVMRRRSSVAYFFARHLQDSLQVPVGVMIAAWGGSPAEAWTPAEVVHGSPSIANNMVTTANPWWPMEAGVLYNQMIHPLLPFTFAGAIWYQGETNRENPEYYGR